ncbi:PP2C family serine/threonine-protein phosphatase [Pedobacter xixiisoli]|uniref:Protein phosphatase 2C n=1 Tax=Pedobacter xixiisoli TaxID=1476464 RepID=A0A285ZSQ3_9SPHI|nr:PP2C family serine/threonine-protein phosphatase [Pedobacter xixiisoli]SOD12682.1 Protein phosphatase 2C [Pedobacter xixiisoli]
MDETDRYIRALLQQQGISIDENQSELFRAFVNTEANINSVKNIRLLQQNMTKDWKIIARRAEINALQLAFPNGIAGKPYQTKFDFKQYGLEDITSYGLSGFENTGLAYDANSKTISGTPKTSGDIAMLFSYNFEGEDENSPLNEKKVTIIINPDPKSLWKDIPSDTNDIYAKADNVAETASLLDFTLLAASKRGRSHANKGSFRDDDYAYAELQNGWGIVAISDGAGSAKFSRKGSLLACNAVVDYFTTHFSLENVALLDEAITIYQTDTSIRAKLLDIAGAHLSAAAKKAYATINDFALDANASVSDFHATLAFVLVKKFANGYAFLSFSVGDCPMALVNKSFEWVKPLNKLDVGEYGGGTRFITMEDIFTKENFEERFNFEFTTDLPYLVLMTDGIYDPKFEVEANLAKTEKWKLFFEDLEGNNSEGINALSKDADNQSNLSDWMDFWSPGNHDDRTLIVLS